VGHDGIYLSEVLRPRLTTLKQDTVLLGKEAAAMLIEAIESPKTFIPKQVVIPVHLIEGRTVKSLSPSKSVVDL
jgi:LacI family transcriptional regulator